MIIVDTPGFGDTKGLHHDSNTVSQIEKFFARQNPGEQSKPPKKSDKNDGTLTAVCFVAKSNENRLKA
jgi:hypothetical protein